MSHCRTRRHKKNGLFSATASVLCSFSQISSVIRPQEIKIQESRLKTQRLCTTVIIVTVIVGSSHTSKDSDD